MQYKYCDIVSCQSDEICKLWLPNVNKADLSADEP